MTLTADEMRQIMLDRMLRPEKEPTVKGREADRFRERFEEDIRRAEADGTVIEIPGEWEVDEP